MIEDLYSIVVSIADEQASSRIHRERMRLIEFARSRPQFTPALDEFAVVREFQNAVISRPMSFGNKDVAVGRNQNVIRLVKVIRLCGPARLTQRHEQSTFRTELVYLISFRGPGARTDRPPTTRGFTSGTFTTGGLRSVVLTIGYPYVAPAIHKDPVRENQHPLTETFHQLSRRIELQNRRQR